MPVDRDGMNFIPVHAFVIWRKMQVVLLLGVFGFWLTSIV